MNSINSRRTVSCVNDVLNRTGQGFGLYRTSISILMRTREQFGGMKMEFGNVLMSDRLMYRWII
jgi:hypothetical protein